MVVGLDVNITIYGILLINKLFNLTDRDSFNNKGYMADSSTSFPMLHSSVLKYFVLLINSEHTGDKSLLLFDLMIVSLTYLAKKNFE